ncbi:MAG: ATP-binding cassette domain-containing protein [FCB group bacterium]|nr:ATP-binding cassette domain-containing protein [FCB group bacterium]
MIRFRDVSFTYGSQEIFSNLSFHLERDSFLTISGPAKAGKTTMVQLITGMILPDEGEILIDGMSTVEAVASGSKLRQLRRKIGGAGGIYSLLGDRTILENIALSAEIGGLPAPAARKTAFEVCQKYRLNHVATNFPDMVSEVERRAAQIARAETARKGLIVADSPADGLDTKSARFINERLAAVHLAGVAILYLTSGPGPQSGPDSVLELRNGTVVS